VNGQRIVVSHSVLMGNLFRAASDLLRRGVELEALQVLHAELAQLLGEPAEIRIPARYSSLSEARAQHDRLISGWAAREPGPAPTSPLRELWDRRPPWFSRIAVAVLFLLLTLRYVWTVTYGKNWSQQNPEGNWISRFYKNGTFEGYPLLRYDVGVDADWGAGAPADSVKKDNFSARWDTCLLVTQDVVVALALDSDDSSKFFVDDQLQFEVEPGPGHNSASVAFHRGLRHVRVDFNERKGMAMVQLSGFESEGTEAYSFRRPVVEGLELRCR
jgi:hypothetical protein